MYFKEGITDEELKELIVKNNCMINALMKMNEIAESELVDRMNEQTQEELSEFIESLHGKRLTEAIFER